MKTLLAGHILSLCLFVSTVVFSQTAGKNESHVKLFSQVIDLRAKEDTSDRFNHANAQDSLLRSIVAVLRAGKIIAYADSSFKQQFRASDINRIVGDTILLDTIFGYEPERNEDVEIIVQYDFDFYGLTNFKILAGSDHSMGLQVFGIAPCKLAYQNTDHRYVHQYKAPRTMFWVRYSDVQEILQQYDAAHPANKFSSKLKEVKVPETDVLYLQNGDKYIGYTTNGRPNGIGTIYMGDGSRCTGQWKNGKQTGEGTYYAREGWKYVGHFEDGKFDGKGTKYFFSGDEYSGTWKDGHMSGEGIFKWKNGCKYIGHFENDTYNGRGIFKWTDGSKYEGEMKDGCYDGYGVYEVGNKEKYDAEYCPGCVIYKGFYKKNKRSGDGTCYDIHGSIIYQGKFLDGKPIGPYPANK